MALDFGLLRVESEGRVWGRGGGVTARGKGSPSFRVIENIDPNVNLFVNRIDSLPALLCAILT